MSMRLTNDEATEVWLQKSPEAMLATKTWSTSRRFSRMPASMRASVAA